MTCSHLTRYSWVPGLVVLGAAVTLAIGPRLDAFTLTGFSLNTTTITYRTNPISFHNGFPSDTSTSSQADDGSQKNTPEANDNDVADANWPGSFGADLAIRKAASEWSCDARGGTGAGDPLQSVGGVGANFDFFYGGTTIQTLKSGASLSSNIVCAHGELASNVYATAWYSNSGFVIVFDSVTNDYQWQDGPGNEAAATTDPKVDIQGIAAHEFGHALGLFHSTVVGATMYPTIPAQDSTQWRSVDADDIAGVKALYGVKAASKPVISSVALLDDGTRLRITGSNFGSNPRVWLTPEDVEDAAQVPLAPVILTNAVASLGNVEVFIPKGVRSGDVAVQASASTNLSSLSSPWPFTTLGGIGVFGGFGIFGNGTPGCSGTHALSVTATPEIGTTNFAFRCDHAPPNALGLCLIANSTSASPVDPLGLGIFLYVDLTASELLSLDLVSDSNGIGLGSTSIPLVPALVNATYFAQALWGWSGPCTPSPFGLSTSRALEVTIQPLVETFSGSNGSAPDPNVWVPELSCTPNPNSSVTIQGGRLQLLYNKWSDCPFGLGFGVRTNPIPTDFDISIQYFGAVDNSSGYQYNSFGVYDASSLPLSLLAASPKRFAFHFQNFPFQEKSIYFDTPQGLVPLNGVLGAGDQLRIRRVGAVVEFWINEMKKYEAPWDNSLSSLVAGCFVMPGGVNETTGTFYDNFRMRR